MSGARFDSLGDGLRLAYREDGSGDDMARCGFFWLGGFMSDMTGSKAESLAGLARDSRRPSLRSTASPAVSPSADSAQPTPFSVTASPAPVSSRSRRAS